MDCVGGSKGTSSGELEKLKPYILEQAPNDMTAKLDINFENKVRLVGYKVERAGTGPHRRQADHVLKVEDKLDDGWSSYAHRRLQQRAHSPSTTSVAPRGEGIASGPWPSAWEKEGLRRRAEPACLTTKTADFGSPPASGKAMRASR
jgi:hypothetical protein